MLVVEISTVDPGIVFLTIKLVTLAGGEELLFANEIPYRKVAAYIDKYAQEHVLE